MKTKEELAEAGFPIALSAADIERIMEYAHGIHVEVGTFYGGSAYFASFVADEVYTVDCDTSKRPLFTDERFKRDNITFIQKESSEAAKEWTKEIDSLFIDGDHRYNSVRVDILSWLPFLKDGGMIMFHDIQVQSPDVTLAVAEYLFQYHPNEVHWPQEGQTSILVTKHSLPVDKKELPERII